MFVFSIALYRFNVTYWSHVTQKNIEDFGTIMLFYISIVCNIHSL